MAIDLFCHTSIPVGETENIIRRISSQCEDLFSTKFLISDVSSTREIDQEIALEYGLRAESLFLVRLNDKGAVGSIVEVSDKLREFFGVENILVLIENESKV